VDGDGSARHRLVTVADHEVVDPELEWDVPFGLFDGGAFHQHGRYMERASEHVWWLPPGPPDRPSLCAVVGERWTIALDAGSSRAHTRLFLDGLPAVPRAVVYTHSHWDHVFGGVEIGGLVIAQRRTASKLRQMSLVDWNDDANVSEHIRQELPAPRTVEIAQADIVFDKAVDFDLGGVTVRVEHVESDHCDDACIVFVQPDQLLFIGDATCASADGRMTEVTLQLFDRVLADDIRNFVEGHHPAVSSRPEMESLAAKAQAAARGEVTVGDEDSECFAAAFAARPS
jgi:glyoxylase-like metal-dependent hydrolase (beta-lactamase superfamily II)